MNLEPGPGSESHLSQRREQSAVGPIVIGKQQRPLTQSTLSLEESRQRTGMVQICCGAAKPPETLYQHRATKPPFTFGEIDQNQDGVTFGQLQLRRKRSAHIHHRCERGDDE